MVSATFSASIPQNTLDTTPHTTMYEKASTPAGIEYTGYNINLIGKSQRTNPR